MPVAPEYCADVMRQSQQVGETMGRQPACRLVAAHAARRVELPTFALRMRARKNSSALMFVAKLPSIPMKSPTLHPLDRPDVLI